MTADNAINLAPGRLPKLDVPVPTDYGADSETHDMAMVDKDILPDVMYQAVLENSTLTGKVNSTIIH